MRNVWCRPMNHDSIIGCITDPNEAMDTSRQQDTEQSGNNSIKTWVIFTFHVIVSLVLKTSLIGYSMLHYFVTICTEAMASMVPKNNFLLR